MSGRKHPRISRREHEVQRGQRHRPHRRLTADGKCDVDGPVRSVTLAELAGPVERVDDPEATHPGHVLEPLLGAHVVVGVQPIELVDEEAMGKAVPRRSEVPHRRLGGAKLQQCPTGGHRQHRGITVFGMEVVGHGPSF